MANWRLGKIQYGFVSTATSGGTLVLTRSSRQFQILTGTMDHTVQLPDATVVAATGVPFIICNESTGTITVNYNDTTQLTEVKAGQTVELLLTNASTSNGVWRVIATGGSAGLGAVESGAVINSNYTVQATDNGRMLNVDTSAGSIEITLPAPEVGFKLIIKDASGMSASNRIVIKRNGSERIDFAQSDDQITEAYKAVSLVSDGTDWFRVVSFIGDALIVARGIFAGGVNSSSSLQNVIEYVSLSTLGNATDFGDLTVARYAPGACASTIRGLVAGGNTGSQSNIIDYITIATTGNAADFGDLTVARDSLAGCSSSTRGIFAGGQAPANSNVIDYVTIATLGNATDFGDLLTSKYGVGACASPTRGLFAGGFDSGDSNVVQYVTIATTGNAIDFGDLTLARFYLASCSNATRALFGGGAFAGSSYSNTIDYVTIASLGNATDFGDLSVARYLPAACSSSSRGLFAGGSPNGLVGSVTNSIDYVAIASTGNASDFGDLTGAKFSFAGCSNSHGGL